MKKDFLIYLLLAGGLFYLYTNKKKPYKLTVSEPEKISKEQFEAGTLISKGIDIFKKLQPVIKKRIVEKKKSIKGINTFPNFC